MKILVAGGTGFIGKELVRVCQAHGHTCLLLGRNAPPIQPEVLAGCDGVINLAGENIAGRRWTHAVRQQLLLSRIMTAREIVTAISRNLREGLPAPAVLLNASALGYYGTDAQQTFTEDCGPGNTFLAEVCRQWEGAALAAEAAGVRVVRLRLGNVLAEEGGFLGKVAPPFRWGLGSCLGSGEQWISWIHRQELIDIMLQMLTEDTWRGAYNLCAPNPLPLKDFMALLGQALQSRCRFSVPAWLVKLLFGDMAEEILLAGQRAQPRRLLEAGYVFKYPRLPEALQDIYRNK